MNFKFKPEVKCVNSLTTLFQVYRNQSIDLKINSIDWFLYAASFVIGKFVESGSYQVVK